MITVVCGLIGSGKSTWSENQDGIVSDFDEIGSKEQQLHFTLKEHKKGNHVYHITCYPTPREMELFGSMEVEYVWINTSFMQSRKNIFKRKRQRDMVDVGRVLDKNAELIERYTHSSIDFKIVDVFESDEKW